MQYTKETLTHWTQTKPNGMIVIPKNDITEQFSDISFKAIQMALHFLD